MNSTFKFLKKQWQPVLIIALIFGFFKLVEIWVSAQVTEEAPSQEQTAAQELKKAELVGAETCLSCHGDRADFKKNIHAKALPNAKKISFEQSCETCHGPGSLHAGAGGDKSNSDFWTIKNPASMKDASSTCLQCHKTGSRIHWAGSIHDAKKVSCVKCHSMHNAKANSGKSPLLVKASSEETCFQCHAEKKAQIRKSAHMPIKEGKMGCTSCHNPHGSGAEKLMTKASINETCYQCHQDKRGPMLWEHNPVRENCLNCHNPHGSHNEKMLVTRAPLLCQRCHVFSRHPSTLYGPGAIATQSNRLLNKSCANCHSRIHGSNHPSGKYFER